MVKVKVAKKGPLTFADFKFKAMYARHAKREIYDKNNCINLCHSHNGVPLCDKHNLELNKQMKKWFKMVPQEIWDSGQVAIMGRHNITIVDHPDPEGEPFDVDQELKDDLQMLLVNFLLLFSNKLRTPEEYRPLGNEIIHKMAEIYTAKKARA